MARKLIVLILIVLIGWPFAAICQTDQADDNGASEALEPEPYDESEFPPWTRKIRRGEIILIGSFPFTMFFTNLGAQIYKYATSEPDSEFTPSIFGGVQQSDFTDDEKIAVLVTAVSISAAIALTDFIIGEIIEKRNAREEQ